jgi:hypothetical protein
LDGCTNIELMGERSEPPGLASTKNDLGRRKDLPDGRSPRSKCDVNRERNTYLITIECSGFSSIS